MFGLQKVAEEILAAVKNYYRPLELSVGRYHYQT